MCRVLTRLAGKGFAFTEKVRVAMKGLQEQLKLYEVAQRQSGD